jgi:hypothetical protein
LTTFFRPAPQGRRGGRCSGGAAAPLDFYSDSVYIRTEEADRTHERLLSNAVAIVFWIRAGDFLELTVEIGEVVVAAFETNLRDGPVLILMEQFAGIADADLFDKMGESLLGALFEKGTEGTFGNPDL